MSGDRGETGPVGGCREKFKITPTLFGSVNDARLGGCRGTRDAGTVGHKVIKKLTENYQNNDKFVRSRRPEKTYLSVFYTTVNATELVKIRRADIVNVSDRPCRVCRARVRRP